jgi:nitrate/nitrite transporter NarK
MDMNRNPALRQVLCDRRAYTTFHWAAWCMIPLAVMLLFALTPMYDTIAASNPSRLAFQIVSGCVGALGAVAGIVIFLGMLAYLLLLDRTSWKLLWLIVFLFTACFGSSIYFFAVYRKHEAGPYPPG